MIKHTIIEQLGEGRVSVGVQATREFSLAIPARLRHQRSPEVADDHRSALCDERLTHLFPSLRIRPRVLGAPSSVDAAIRASLLVELILVHWGCGDEDDSRVVCEEQGVREDGLEVLAVGWKRDVLLADTAEVAGVVGAEEECLGVSMEPT